MARRGRRRSGAVHGGVAPTGRVEEARTTRKRWCEAQGIGGGGRIDNGSSSTAIEESKDEMTNRVARFQVD